MRNPLAMLAALTGLGLSERDRMMLAAEAGIRPGAHSRMTPGQHRRRRQSQDGRDHRKLVRRAERQRS